jgi:uncharacterized membrane protein
MAGDSSDNTKSKRAKEKFQKGKDELEKQLGIQKNRVDEYAEYYSNNRSEIIDSFLGNFGKNKTPAIAGIIVLAPILVTLFIVDWILDKVDAIPYIDLLNLTNFYIINQFIKLAFIISFGAFLVTVIGRFVRTEKGFNLEKALDSAVDKIPFIGAIYSISKVTADTVFNGAEEFSDPVKLEIQGLQVTGYRTGNTTRNGKEIIFVPTSPNVTTGFVVEVDPEEVIETEETPREAITRTLSAGFGDGRPDKLKRNPVEEEDSHIPVEDEEDES